MMSMHNRMGFVGVFVFLTLAGAAMAADLSGKWVAAVEDGDLEMVFKVNGNKLTGSIDNPLLGGKTKFKDGKIDGDNLSFYVIRLNNFNEKKIMWKGKVEGDVIRFTRMMAGGGGPKQVIAIRQKETTRDISGKWIAGTTSVDIDLVFKVDGATLTGTANNPTHGETKIRDGKIDGNNISFLIERNNGRVVWKGTVTGSVIRFTVATPDGLTIPVIAVRPKEAPPAH
jgi:hypothetical protein